MRRHTSLLASSAGALASCGGSSPEPALVPGPPPIARGNRQLGVVVNDDAPGVYSNTYRGAVNILCPPNNTRVMIELNPIDTNVSHLPADLRDRATTTCS